MYEIDQFTQKVSNFVKDNKLFVSLLCGLGIIALVDHANKKRIFISFAIEDKTARDLFIGQENNEKSPFQFIDMSVKEPWESAWKTNCRDRIKSCDGVIALISKNTIKADGARWEIKCAVEQNIPIIGIHIHKDDKGKVPSELQGQKVIVWDWNAINKFLNSI